MKAKAILCLSVVALVGFVVLAQGAEGGAAAGKLGQPAGTLQGLQWVKGQPVQFQQGKVYVVEFWATWCPPCRASIPHLTELQKQFKDKGVTIVGISNEALDVVKPFVANMAEKMDYTVAIDADGQVSKKYMAAFGVQGIPHAFIVDKDGKLAWHGHPMAQMDGVLEKVLAGNFDSDAYAKQQEMAEAEQARLVKLYSGYFANVGQNKEEAAKIGQDILETSNNAQMLNAFAWRILTDVAETDRDLEAAHKAAAKAVKLTDEKDASILDTYALALYQLGKKYVGQAVTTQRRAVELTNDAQAKEGLSKTLERYEAATVE